MRRDHGKHSCKREFVGIVLRPIRRSIDCRYANDKQLTRSTTAYFPDSVKHHASFCAVDNDGPRQTALARIDLAGRPRVRSGNVSRPDLERTAALASANRKDYLSGWMLVFQKLLGSGCFFKLICL